MQFILPDKSIRPLRLEKASDNLVPLRTMSTHRKRFVCEHSGDFFFSRTGMDIILLRLDEPDAIVMHQNGEMESMSRKRTLQSKWINPIQVTCVNVGEQLARATAYGAAEATAKPAACRLSRPPPVFFFLRVS
ncbi:hypothetical protein CDAR_278901 [Caerostris darwini]|uniref:Uncharacterized protein n=1 Tax=Caerostris darwini TaxID=1538125 RepID=A0AAV4WQ54_9ARAC|nr:hypothetical protein CDAR_278901 [Caerostris darwini]